MARKLFVNEIKLGVFVLVVLVMLAYLSLKIGGVGVGESIHAAVYFEDASGLVKDAAVSIAGVRVGTVRALAVEGKRARIAFSLLPAAGVRNDAVATIRAKSLLGEKYLDILPQSDTAPLLQSGDVFSNVVETTDIDQLITKMKPVLDALVGPAGKPGMLADAAVLTRLLRESVAEAQATMPETMRNLRDLSGDLKAMTAQNSRKFSELLDALNKLAKTSDDVVAQNSRKVSETLDAAHKLAKTSSDLLSRHEQQISRTVENADKIAAGMAAHSGEIAKNLAVISANVAAVSGKLPALTQNLTTLSAKLDATLDVSLRLLNIVEHTDFLYIARKILEEEGITVNLFPRKIIKGQPLDKNEDKPKDPGPQAPGKDGKKP